jgi:hypothetical protein
MSLATSSVKKPLRSRGYDNVADTKFTALPAASTVAGTDLIAITADPAGTPTSKKATVTQVAAGASLNTEVMYNNAGVVDGVPTLTYDGTNTVFDVSATSGTKIQIKGNATKNVYIQNANQFLILMHNLYFDGTNYKYDSTAAGSHLLLGNGNFFVYTTPSGTVGTNAPAGFAFGVYNSTGVGIGSGQTDPGVGKLSTQNGYEINRVPFCDGIARVITTDFTTTSLTNVTITGLTSATLAINTLYEFEMSLFCASSDANGLQVGIAASGALSTFTGFSGTATGNSTSIAVTIGSQANDVASGTFLNAAANGVVRVHGFMKTSGTAGSAINGRIRKVTAGTATVYVGSCLKWRQAYP